MSRVTRTALRLCCCACLLFTFASAAAAEAPVASPVAPEPPGCGVERVLFSGGPIELSTCTLSIECDDGSIISCNGNSSCYTTSGGRCAVCDGVQAGCCAKTCCESCEEEYLDCLSTCGGVGFLCNQCGIAYSRCTGYCTGGCS